MTILKIIETLQIYSEDFIAYKLDGQFANAVTEAVSLLISQGEQIADLENKLATVNGGWIPVTERMPEHEDPVLCFIKNGQQDILQFDKFENLWVGMQWTYKRHAVTHWMPIPDCPNDKIDYEAR